MVQEQKEWKRGGSPQSVADILDRIRRTLAPASAARSSDGSRGRVQELVARGRPFARKLVSIAPHQAVDLLLSEAGFMDKDRNKRLRWSRLLAHRLGPDAGLLVLWLLVDVVADGTAISVGGCLSHRLPKIAAGRPREALSGQAPEELAIALEQAIARHAGT